MIDKHRFIKFATVEDLSKNVQKNSIFFYLILKYLYDKIKNVKLFF